MAKNIRAEASAQPDPIAADAGRASSVEVSQKTLDTTPTRALAFLRAIGTGREIRSILRQFGYTPAEHRRGWALLHQASGYDDRQAEPEDDRTVAQSVAEIDAWDEKGFRVAAAALKHRHPDAYRFVFDGLAPATGTAAILSVTTFLDRLDQVQKGAASGITPKQGQAALATLAERGITAEVRAHLRSLLKAAEHLGDTTTPDEAVSDEAGAAHEQALVALRAFYEEWSEIAKTAISRRDYLIRLGLAQRKMPAKPTPTPPAPSPAPPR